MQCIINHEKSSLSYSCFCFPMFLYAWPLTVITHFHCPSVSPFSFFSSSLFALSVFPVVANCIPQCQNGGMCLRPQLCVCKPGSNGKVCEQKTVPTHPFPALPGNGPTNGHTNGPTNGHNGVPQRPIPQQVLPNGHASAPPPSSNMAQMKLTVKPAQLVRPHYIQQHIQQQ